MNPLNLPREILANIISYMFPSEEISIGEIIRILRKVLLIQDPEAFMSNSAIWDIIRKKLSLNRSTVAHSPSMRYGWFFEVRETRFKIKVCWLNYRIIAIPAPDIGEDVYIYELINNNDEMIFQWVPLNENTDFNFYQREKYLVVGDEEYSEQGPNNIRIRVYNSNMKLVYTTYYYYSYGSSFFSLSKIKDGMAITLPSNYKNMNIDFFIRDDKVSQGIDYKADNRQWMGYYGKFHKQDDGLHYLFEMNNAQIDNLVPSKSDYLDNSHSARGVDIIFRSNKKCDIYSALKNKILWTFVGRKWEFETYDNFLFDEKAVYDLQTGEILIDSADYDGKEIKGITLNEDRSGYIIWLNQ